MEVECTHCGFELWVPVAALSVTTVGLYDDARFPSRCIVELNEHHEDFAELDAVLAHAFLDDVQRVARAVRAVTGAPRLNFAVLGNVEPHIHAHVVPRGLAGDPVPTRPPWLHPEPVTPLDPTERADLVEELRSHLEP